MEDAVIGFMILLVILVFAFRNKMFSIMAFVMVTALLILKIVGYTIFPHIHIMVVIVSFLMFFVGTFFISFLWEQNVEKWRKTRSMILFTLSTIAFMLIQISVHQQVIFVEEITSQNCDAFVCEQ